MSKEFLNIEYAASVSKDATVLCHDGDRVVETPKSNFGSSGGGGVSGLSLWMDMLTGEGNVYIDITNGGTEAYIDDDVYEQITNTITNDHTFPLLSLSIMAGGSVLLGGNAMLIASSGQLGLTLSDTVDVGPFEMYPKSDM